MLASTAVIVATVNLSEALNIDELLKDKITKSDEESALADLIRDSYKLECLELYGVDNWGGYSEALGGDDDDYLTYMLRTNHDIAKEYLKDNPDVLYTLQDYKDWTS